MRRFLGYALSTCLLIAATPCLAANSAVTCDSWREYITSYRYLLDKKLIVFTKDQASQTAFQVARGCNGAAERFIRVFDLLINAKISIPQSSEIALEIAQADSDSGESFVAIFKTAYLEKHLDLSLDNALNLARSLSTKVASGSRQAQKDFSKMVEFCLSAKGLALPKQDCAQLAAEITRLGQDPEGKSVAEGYLETLDFLRDSSDGPKLATFEAMAVTKELMTISAEAGSNFIPSYKFALDKDQLGLDRTSAIGFAKNLSLLSRKPTDPGRLSEAK
jgi:hypothetical protein